MEDSDQLSTNAPTGADVAADISIPPRLSLLGLPAEIRNRIYHFADERAYKIVRESVPQLVHKQVDQWPIEDLTRSARKFYGLTQVCRQLRSEYLPIWRRDSFIRVDANDSVSFIEQIYGEQYGPKLLQIIWKNKSSGSIGLIPYILYRISHPNTKLEFVPDELVDLPSKLFIWGFERCDTCGHIWKGIGTALCPEQELQHQTIANQHRSLYRYIDDFNRAIQLDNKAFEEEIKSGDFFSISARYEQNLRADVRLVLCPLNHIPKGRMYTIGKTDDVERKHYFEKMGICSPLFQWIIIRPQFAGFRHHSAVA